MSLVHHQHVQLRPKVALGHRLSRCDLQQLVGAATPVIRLNDAVLGQAVAVGSFRRLIDQGGAVTQEHRALALLHCFVANAKAKVGLACARGGHDQLVFVASFEPIAQGSVGVKLEWTWRWKS